jgi:type II secretory ATPase GspE/PulE/Tfp pilus assembly ATPase PilB-like protein
LTFATILNRRHDPTSLVGDARSETVEIGLRAAMTGHLFSTRNAERHPAVSRLLTWAPRAI